MRTSASTATADTGALVQRLRRLTTRVPFLLFVLLATVYALTSAGRLDSADGRVVALTAQWLIQHHTIALPASTPDAVRGVGGFGYLKYGIAQGLVEIPLVLLGLLLRHLTHLAQMVEWTVALTNGPITALGGVLFYGILRRLGASARRGVVLTLIYGLSTLAWPYAKTDFNEPLQAVTLLAAFSAALIARERGATRWWLAVGGALAGTILTKAALGVAVAPFALYTVVVDLRDAPDPHATGATQQVRDRWLRVAEHQAALWAPVVLASLFTLWLNAVRFGSPLNFGYDVAGGDVPLKIPVYIGAFGLLFSFNSGLIFYSSPVLLGLFGLRRFARRHGVELLFIGALTLVFLALYGTYTHWAGLAAYGPRYLVPLIPFLLLPAVEAFPEGVAGLRRAPALAGLAAALIVLGVAAQVLGVVVGFGAYSVLTCTTFPCPASLDASQSEILYNIWLLPSSVAYNFLAIAPHIVPSAYPFGAPPTPRADVAAGLAFGMRYFWFAALPHPKLWLLLGTLAGALIVWATGVGLWQALGLGRSGAGGHAPADEAVPVAVAIDTPARRAGRDAPDA